MRTEGCLEMAERGSVMVKRCLINACLWTVITDGLGRPAEPGEIGLCGAQPWRGTVSGTSALSGCQVNSRGNAWLRLQVTNSIYDLKCFVPMQMTRRYFYIHTDVNQPPQ